MKRNMLIVLACWLAASTATFAAPAVHSRSGAPPVFPPTPTFVAPLSGLTETPPVQTEGKGMANFFLSRDGNELRYVVTLDQVRDVTMAHLHMAAKGENGPVVAWLYPRVPPPKLRKETTGELSAGILTARTCKARSRASRSRIW